MQEPPDSQPPGRRFGAVMIVLAWLAGLAVVALVMQNLIDDRHNPNTQVRVRTAEDGVKQLVLQRNSYGHYVANGTINGRKATFMLDTGATDVVVPGALAEDYGLERGYPQQARTANGVVTVHTTTIERITLGPAAGPIALEDVRASINPHMDGDQVLLGMSFLKDFNLSQSSDRLIISNP